jgi:hypothetical protein
VPTVKPAPRVPAQAQAITPAATTVLRVESSSLRPVQQLTCQELRPLCTEHSIKWRNVNATSDLLLCNQIVASQSCYQRGSGALAYCQELLPLQHPRPFLPVSQLWVVPNR